MGACFACTEAVRVRFPGDPPKFSITTFLANRPAVNDPYTSTPTGGAKTLTFRVWCTGQHFPFGAERIKFES